MLKLLLDKKIFQEKKTFSWKKVKSHDTQTLEIVKESFVLSHVIDCLEARILLGY